MVFGEKYFLKSYSECRACLLNEKIRDGEISRNATLSFSMFFDNKNHPNVFFLDRELTEMVYVHDQCPNSSFFSDIKKYPGAYMRRPHFNCECEFVNEECGEIMPFREKKTTEDIGKKCSFWEDYGKECEELILLDDEEACGSASMVEAKINKRMQALAMRHKNQAANTPPVAASDAFSTPQEDKSRSTVTTYYPWQKFDWEKWLTYFQDEQKAESAYDSIRQARLKVQDEKRYRKKDKVLRGEYTFAEETDLAKLIEKDMRHLSLMKRRKEWLSGA